MYEMHVWVYEIVFDSQNVYDRTVLFNISYKKQCGFIHYIEQNHNKNR